MVRKHTLCDLSLFKFTKICFDFSFAQNISRRMDDQRVPYRKVNLFMLGEVSNTYGSFILLL